MNEPTPVCAGAFRKGGCSLGFKPEKPEQGNGDSAQKKKDEFADMVCLTVRIVI